MGFLENPKPNVKRGYGVQTVNYSISFSRPIAALLDQFIEEEGVSRSYFVQECVKRGLERYKEGGFVYVIKWGDKDRDGLQTIKIGKTRNPHERLHILAGNGTSLPVELEMFHLIDCAHSRKVEKLLHKHFNKKRVNQGEYFKVDDDDLKWFIEEGYRDIRGINQYLD